MNYYDHHLRDYDAATAHLSWDEDQAYTRLLRWYYRKEKPIPSDVKEACRQVRATTKTQREAVGVVLREFFELRDDGWHQDTCDETIAAFQAGEPVREAKKTNEEVRLARHRAERAELFEIINAARIHRPWNTPMAELRTLAAALQDTGPATPDTPTSNAPATQPATGTATPATATHGNASPTPTPHSPLPTSHDVAEETPPGPPGLPATPATPATAVLPPTPTAEQPGVPDSPTRNAFDEARDREPPPPPSPQTVAVVALRSVGIGKANAGDPRLLALVGRGASTDHFAAAGKAAIDAKARDPFAYALQIVSSQLDEAHALAGRTNGAAMRSTRPPTKTESQAAFLGALSGRPPSPPNGDNDANSQPGAIDVESRVIDRS